MFVVVIKWLEWRRVEWDIEEGGLIDIYGSKKDSELMNFI